MSKRNYKSYISLSSIEWSNGTKTKGLQYSTSFRTSKSIKGKDEIIKSCDRERSSCKRETISHSKSSNNNVERRSSVFCSGEIRNRLKFHERSSIRDEFSNASSTSSYNNTNPLRKQSLSLRYSRGDSPLRLQSKIVKGKSDARSRKYNNKNKKNKCKIVCKPKTEESSNEEYLPQDLNSGELPNVLCTMQPSMFVPSQIIEANLKDLSYNWVNVAPIAVNKSQYINIDDENYYNVVHAKKPTAVWHEVSRVNLGDIPISKTNIKAYSNSSDRSSYRMYTNSIKSETDVKEMFYDDRIIDEKENESNITEENEMIIEKEISIKSITSDFNLEVQNNIISDNLINDKSHSFDVTNVLYSFFVDFLNKTNKENKLNNHIKNDMDSVVITEISEVSTLDAESSRHFCDQQNIEDFPKKVLTSVLPLVDHLPDLMACTGSAKQDHKFARGIKSDLCKLKKTLQFNQPVSNHVDNFDNQSLEDLKCRCAQSQELKNIINAKLNSTPPTLLNLKEEILDYSNKDDVPVDLNNKDLSHEHKSELFKSLKHIMRSKVKTTRQKESNTSLVKLLNTSGELVEGTTSVDYFKRILAKANKKIKKKKSSKKVKKDPSKNKNKAFKITAGGKSNNKKNISNINSPLSVRSNVMRNLIRVTEQKTKKSKLKISEDQRPSSSKNKSNQPSKHGKILEKRPFVTHIPNYLNMHTVERLKKFNQFVESEANELKSREKVYNLNNVDTKHINTKNEKLESLTTNLNTTSTNPLNSLTESYKLPKSRKFMGEMKSSIRKHEKTVPEKCFKDFSYKTKPITQKKENESDKKDWRNARQTNHNLTLLSSTILEDIGNENSISSDTRECELNEKVEDIKEDYFQRSMFPATVCSNVGCEVMDAGYYPAVCSDIPASGESTDGDIPQGDTNGNGKIKW